MAVIRFDGIDLGKPVRTPAGYLRVDAYLTRAGVFKYQDSSGKVYRELRHPDDVFAPESLATLPGVPVTNEHPAPAKLDSKNAKRYQAGSVGDHVEITDDKKIKARLAITDSELIQDIDDGTRQEISCGYTCDVDPENGTYEGEPYDARQRNIVYNHVAVVEKGRAGPDIRLRADGAAVLIDDAGTPAYKQESRQKPGQGAVMASKTRKDAKIKLGDAEYECSDELAKAFETHMQQQQKPAEKDAAFEGKETPAEEAAEEAETEKKEDNGDMPAENYPDKKVATGKQLGSAGQMSGPTDKGMGGNKDSYDALKGRADSLEAEVSRLRAQLSPENLAKVVEERASLLKTAEKFGVRADAAATAIDVKRQVIGKLAPELNIADATEAYVDGAFSALTAAADAAPSAGYVKMRAATAPTTEKKDSVSPYEAMLKRNQDAYKAKKGTK